MSFNPDRFLVSKEGEHHEPEWDPYQLVFGFGRRICPGQAFADATVFLTIVKTLAVFNITKDVDKLGSEVTPSINYSPGLIAYPAPFPSQIHLRSVNAEKLIQAVDIEHPWTEGDSKVFNDIKFEAMP